ncbi:MAG TPA: SDR family oxidoreductase [Alphaproteobacteria bacterium]|jgi:3-oxoacyl-[acyl-carrier protein] reductase
MAEISPSYPTIDLTDRVIIVTGGAKGIGKVYSERLAAANARVVVADIDRAANDEMAESIVASGGEAISQPTDVTSPEATEAMAKAAIAKWGRIDGLVNNASLMSVLGRKPWHEIPLEEWDRVMTVNLRGIFLCCLAVYPQMKAQGAGKIVNIASNRVWDGTPNRLHYTTSKAGVVGFTRALAREVGADNITVNAISPGLTQSETQMATTSNAYTAKADETKSLKRAQVPDDLVGALMFLLSDASNFMTGQTMNIDGGQMMR